MPPEPINWIATISGIAAAYGLGMLWFSPLMFGRAWAAGSHGIKPPDRPPVAAMLLQLAGTIALGLVVGLTAATNALPTAILAILAAALLVAGMDLFSRKNPAATAIDAGYLICAGALMIAAQAIF